MSFVYYICISVTRYELIHISTELLDNYWSI